MKTISALDFIKHDTLLPEFYAFAQNVKWTGRNPLNTELFFLWSIIQKLQPLVFFESGTFKGYSSEFICEALSRYNSSVEFMTFDINMFDSVNYAKSRLKRFKFADVCEGDSRAALKKLKNEDRPTAFFVDGPKGQNMIPLFMLLLRQFENISFIAVHDCHIGNWNRRYLRDFFSFEYPLIFTDSKFQEKYAFLDEPLIGRSSDSPWRPYFFQGREQQSYGTETGYVIPSVGRLPDAPPRLICWWYRHLRFHLWFHFKMMLKAAVKR